jgi:hypothetical protein
VTLAVNPPTTRPDNEIRVAADVKVWASTAQTLTEQFTLTSPHGPSCSQAARRLFTTRPFTLQLSPITRRWRAGARNEQNRSSKLHDEIQCVNFCSLRERRDMFESEIAERACAGSYTITATTLIKRDMVLRGLN